MYHAGRYFIFVWSLQVPRDTSGASVMVELQGPEDAKNLARDLILEICESAGDQGFGGRGFGRSRDDGGFGGGFGGRSGGDFGDEVTEVEVACGDIGRIIGVCFFEQILIPAGFPYVLTTQLISRCNLFFRIFLLAQCFCSFHLGVKP